MNKQPTFLDQIFDNLSFIPSFRKISKAIWVFSTIFFGYALLLEGISIFTEKTEFRVEWVKNLFLWVGVNPFWAYFLYRWNKREQEVQAISKEKQ